MSSQTPSHQGISTALRNKSYTILNEWQVLVRARIDAAEGTSAPVLVDHLPLIIANLAEAFEEDASHKKLHPNNRKFGIEHAKQRALKTDFSLDEILLEYSLLRQVVLKEIFPENEWTIKVAHTLHKFFDESIQSAVVEFVNLQNQNMENTLKELNKERVIRERFVAAMSHDLRTPLAAAKISAQLIEKRPGDEDLVAKHIPKIISHVNRIDFMIQDLLDATSVKGGQNLELEFQECSLSEILSDTLSDLTSIHGERFISDCQEEIKGTWSCSGIRRILENLCNNAIKYGSDITPVTISAEKNNDKVILRVHNQGNPLPPEEIKDIFKQYHRVESTKGPGKKGWGIGLTLVQGLVRSHGGEIQVQSDHKNGTIFKIELPLDSRIEV